MLYWYFYLSKGSEYFFHHVENVPTNLGSSDVGVFFIIITPNMIIEKFKNVVFLLIHTNTAEKCRK